MSKKKHSKLSLSRETVRALHSSELQHAGGAVEVIATVQNIKTFVLICVDPYRTLDPKACIMTLRLCPGTGWACRR